MTRLRDQSGQTLVLSIVFLVVLLGMTAMVLDVGAWFRAQRATQATADSAALAAAQALPQRPELAMSLALSYADRNGGGLKPAGVQFLDTTAAADTIRVSVSRAVPGFFAQIFSIDSVQVGARAAARAYKPGAARWAAPIVVRIDHPKLSGPGCPCFDAPTTIPLGKAGAPGAFRLINLDQSGTGTTGTSTLATWIQNGFDGYLPLDSYYSDPGAKYNSSQIQNALDNRIGTDLLFPVYDTLIGSGAGAQYHVIAWAVFRLTDQVASGTNGTLSGYFKETIWQGIESTTGNNSPYLGVHSIQLLQ